MKDSTDTNANTKRMKIEARVFTQELKSRDKNAEHEHALKVKMVDQDHEWSIVSEKTKQLELTTKNLELELRLEEMRLRRLELEKLGNHDDEN